MLFFSGVFPFDGLFDSSHSRKNSLFKFPLAKKRGDTVADDFSRESVCEYSLQSIAYFNADLAVVLEHQKKHTVVLIFLPRFPGLDQTNGNRGKKIRTTVC